MFRNSTDFIFLSRFTLYNKTHLYKTFLDIMLCDVLLAQNASNIGFSIELFKKPEFICTYF